MLWVKKLKKLTPHLTFAQRLHDIMSIVALSCVALHCSALYQVLCIMFHHNTLNDTQQHDWQYNAWQCTTIRQDTQYLPPNFMVKPRHTTMWHSWVQLSYVVPHCCALHCHVSYRVSSRIVVCRILCCFECRGQIMTHNIQFGTNMIPYYAPLLS